MIPGGNLMKKRQKLKDWYDEKRLNGAAVSLKFYLGSDREVFLEDVAEEAFEVLSGARETIDETDLPC